MVGRLYGGLTLEEFNRLQCDSVDTSERLEPVSPVWGGLPAILERKTLTLARRLV